MPGWPGRSVRAWRAGAWQESAGPGLGPGSPRGAASAGSPGEASAGFAPRAVRRLTPSELEVDKALVGGCIRDCEVEGQRSEARDICRSKGDGRVQLGQ